MDFGANLANARKSSGMSQKQLAEHLGVYQKDISRWENGSRTPSIHALKAICEELNVSADILLEIKSGSTPT